MKKYLIALVTLVIFSIPEPGVAAPSQPGPYFSGFLGTSLSKNLNVSNYDYLFNSAYNDRLSLDPGILAGVTGGYDFGIMRIEGELSYRNAKIDKLTDTTGEQFRNIDGDLGIYTTMVNVFFDMHNTSPITPYLGGGIGVATLHMSDTYGYGNTLGYTQLYGDSSDTVLAAQVGAGLDIALNRHLSLDLGYRYFITDQANFDTNWISSSMRFESHNATVGLRFKF
jgi:opacity protein-like surface antigen